MDLEQQLRAALVPTKPRPQVRAAVMERIAAESGRPGPNRWVLTGVVLALAAAAAMFTMGLLEPGVSAVVVDSASASIASPNDGHDAPLLLDTDATGASTVTQDVEPQSLAPAIKPFTAQVMPLQSDVVDASRKAAIEATYAAFVDGLRAVPGLTLVEPATDDGAAPVAANYRLTLRGIANVESPLTVAGDFHVEMEAERLNPGGQMGGTYYTGMVGEIAPRCTSPSSMDPVAKASSCADPTGIASGLIGTLRKMMFPPDPQLLGRLRSRLVDQRLDSDERLRVLGDLALFGRMSGTYERTTFPPSLRDSAVVGAAIQLAATTPDPGARAQVWYTLRGSRDPALVRPLVAALRADTDDDTRVQALATLAADFGNDPQVRPALEAAAARDSNPMVRALAGRALGAESGWTEYVLASLKDEGRPPVERIEALFYAYGLPTSRQYASFAADGRILQALDDAAMRALAEVLPKAAADSQRYARASHTLVSELAFMKHPAITDMLLDDLNSASPWLDRGFAMRGLRSTGDPRALAALEKIAAEDPDPKARELARDTLKPPSVSAPAAGADSPPTGPLPPRLGVVTDHVKAAPDVPAELVGKVVVVRLGPGFPAERAGMKEGDVLLEIGGKPITSGAQLIEVLDALPRDVDIDVQISRNGQIMRLTARF